MAGKRRSRSTTRQKLPLRRWTCCRSSRTNGRRQRGRRIVARSVDMRSGMDRFAWSVQSRARDPRALQRGGSASSHPPRLQGKATDRRGRMIHAPTSRSERPQLRLLRCGHGGGRKDQSQSRFGSSQRRTQSALGGRRRRSLAVRRSRCRSANRGNETVAGSSAARRARGQPM